MVELVRTRLVALGDIAEFVRGITFKSTDVAHGPTDTNVDCLRTKNVQASLDTRDVWAIDPSFVKRPNQYVTEGDILISNANSWNLVGKCSWIPRLERPTAFGGFVTVLRRRDDSVDSRYLFHWFSSDRVQRKIRSFGNQTTNISNLDLKRSASLTFPLPPLDEQRRIAAILDKADELRTKRRQALARLDDLAPAIFHDMFGDPISNPLGFPCKPLTEVGHLYSGGTPSKAHPGNWIGSLPWFSPKDMKRDDLFDSADHIDEDVTVRSSLKRLPKDTVAFVVRGMILAHTFPVSVIRVESTVNQDMKAVIPRESIDPDFLATCLRVQAGRVLSLVDTAAHGTKKLDARALSNIQILVPSLADQTEFAERVAAVGRLKAHHGAQLAELDGLFATLQHRAFSGQLS
ncbi:type I restriction enzyme S subunit [Arthrobacter sp. UYP6]|uniref:restriction endonuclease subunit S n=1 Tax=Arthrobacter sp. UYP6 TaxID=1756378 RepID=UPI0033976E4A